MTIDPTSAAGGAAGAADASSSLTRNDGLGRDAFLQLLITQLQHQDPTRPQENGELLVQLAQFSSLEKLTEISTGIDRISQLLEQHTLNPPATGGKS